MDSKSQFTPPCPSCSSHGEPHVVWMHQGERTITFVCPACKATWTATDIVPILVTVDYQHSR